MARRYREGSELLEMSCAAGRYLCTWLVWPGILADVLFQNTVVKEDVQIHVMRQYSTPEDALKELEKYSLHIYSFDGEPPLGSFVKCPDGTAISIPLVLLLLSMIIMLVCIQAP